VAAERIEIRADPVAAETLDLRALRASHAFFLRSISIMVRCCKVFTCTWSKASHSSLSLQPLLKDEESLHEEP
jgi:hypothetical protein